MDPIRRKLAIIDAELAGTKTAYRLLAGNSPLLFCALGLIVGVLIQHRLLLPLSFWLILLIIFASASAVTYLCRHRIVSYTLMFLCTCALICFACLGAVRLTVFQQPQPNDIRNFIGDERTLATIRGRILTDPHVNTNSDWQFARFRHADVSTGFYLALDEVETTTGWAKSAGTIRVYVDEPLFDLTPGDYLQAYCWLDRFKHPSNPGQFDSARHLARRAVYVAASVPSQDAIELLTDNTGGVFRRIKSRLRETAAAALLGETDITDQSQGLLQALLLGYRGNISGDTYRAFKRTGLLHFISLSGLHFGILLGTVWWLCKTAGLMKRSRAAVCIITITLFLLVVPPRAPTIRAAVIAFVFCLSFFFRRRSNPLNTLSLAAVVLLLIRPTQLFEAGWQLSFAAVLGILLFADRIENFIHEKTDWRLWPDNSKQTKPAVAIGTNLASKIVTLFSVGFAAWLGGAGVLLYYFHSITPLACVWTIVVFPLVAALLILGFLKIILFFLLPTLSTVLGLVVNAAAMGMIYIVKSLAYLDFSHTLIGRVPTLSIIACYLLLAFAAFPYSGSDRLKKAICTAAILALAVYFGAVKWQRTHRDYLQLTCLDVSHGQAIVAQLPGGANILFDAGSQHRQDIGRRIVAPFLDYSGIKKLDAVVISHNDTDHINGIPELVEHCQIGAIYANAAFFEKADRWSTAKFLAEFVHSKQLQFQRCDRQLPLANNTEIKYIWPPDNPPLTRSLSDNDSSLVTLMEFAGRKILLCSDIEQFAQQQIIRRFPDLRADVIIAPHHGSVKTGDAEFLERLDPDFLISSCGRRQYQRQELEELQTPAKRFYTHKNGAITVRITADGKIHTHTFLP